MEFLITDFEARILADNVYMYSLDLHLSIETDLNEKLKIAVAQLWEISTELIPKKLKFYTGIFSPIKAEIFIEIAFRSSIGTIFELFTKMKKIFSPLGQIKLKSVKIISAPVVEKDWRAIISNYLKVHWLEIGVGFLTLLILLRLLKSKK